MMPLSKFKRMESIYKKEYVNAILLEHDQVNEQLSARKLKVQNTYQTCEDAIMDIEGYKGQWNEGLDAINMALLKKAEEMDLSKNEFVTKFKEFNITGMIKKIKNCKKCLDLEYCP